MQLFLELSKIKMYDCHNTYILKKFKTQAQLLLTATATLFYKISKEDVFKDFWKEILKA